MLATILAYCASVLRYVTSCNPKPAPAMANEEVNQQRETQIPMFEPMECIEEEYEIEEADTPSKNQEYKDFLASKTPDDNEDQFNNYRSTPVKRQCEDCLHDSDSQVQVRKRLRIEESPVIECKEDTKTSEFAETKSVNDNDEIKSSTMNAEEDYRTTTPDPPLENIKTYRSTTTKSGKEDNDKREATQQDTKHTKASNFQRMERIDEADCEDEDSDIPNPNREFMAYLANMAPQDEMNINRSSSVKRAHEGAYDFQVQGKKRQMEESLVDHEEGTKTPDFIATNSESTNEINASMSNISNIPNSHSTQETQEEAPSTTAKMKIRKHVPKINMENCLDPLEDAGVTKDNMTANDATPIAKSLGAEDKREKRQERHNHQGGIHRHQEYFLWPMKSQNRNQMKKRPLLADQLDLTAKRCKLSALHLLAQL
ncbi:hypothetical protein AC1031_017229 [Aphanomyces cochlioides]|nr:hypothetical protein AC1031_017229 [Aphanomyces cochlioides]